MTTHDPSSPLHQRLTAITSDLTYRQIADLTETNAETARRYVQGAAPSVEFLAALSQKLEINAEWLLTGRGVIKRRDAKAAALREANVAELLHSLASTLERLIDRVDRLEVYVQTMETRLRAAAAEAGPHAAGATGSPMGAGVDGQDLGSALLGALNATGTAVRDTHGAAIDERGEQSPARDGLTASDEPRRSGGHGMGVQGTGGRGIDNRGQAHMELTDGTTQEETRRRATPLRRGPGQGHAAPHDAPHASGHTPSDPSSTGGAGVSSGGAQRPTPVVAADHWPPASHSTLRALDHFTKRPNGGGGGGGGGISGGGGIGEGGGARDGRGPGGAW